ncbi:hypothetical protein [Halorubellus salinus]|uniref:hypothetical protein n=1 Tax=Halorubellus salinus TaxID=755309 RepID=UPI001D07A784|nr:hypothetical protein [Halorubellus salinus]
MLYVGSDDGVYRFGDALEREHRPAATRVLDAGSAMRLRSFDDPERPDGLFAATASGLHHSPDGDEWVDLGVPREAVYAVGASADGRRLYAGTRPAAVYTATVPDSSVLDASALDWREREGFQALPSREHWRLPRHEDLAHVRDAKGLPGDPDGVVAAVEVGGVHASADRGETWTERRGPITDPRPEDAPGDAVDWSKRPGDVHDDVHELAVLDDSQWVAATGFGLFETTDAGASWTRLDEDVEQGYFRTVRHNDGVTYAAAATSSSGNWDDPDVTAGFFAYTPDDGLRELEYDTPDEVVTGITVVDADDADDANETADVDDADVRFAGTHRGSLLRETATGEWTTVGAFPTDARSGTYTPLAWLAE